MEGGDADRLDEGAMLSGVKGCAVVVDERTSGWVGGHDKPAETGPAAVGAVKLTEAGCCGEEAMN